MDSDLAIGENFDTPVEKGDINCDGHIDAVDATIMLSAYADLSTCKTRTYLNDSLADWNTDGQINAIDASGILANMQNF